MKDFDLDFITASQKAIFEGLKKIGDEISSFYYDGIVLLNDKDLRTKSYLIAHIAREIDGGLRDVFTDINKDDRCPICGKTFIKDTHFNYICNSLGVSREDSLAEHWHRIAKQFYRLAHRHGVWKETRDGGEVIALWYEYENVLHSLVGNYYHLLDRIDRIITYDKPSKVFLNVLKNLIVIPSIHVYFFNNLKSEKWLKPLKDKNFFDPNNNPKSYEEGGNNYIIHPIWPELIYIKELIKTNVKAKNPKILKLIQEIIYDIIIFRNDDGNRIENYYTDFNIIQILVELPEEFITLEHVEFIRSISKSEYTSDTILYYVGNGIVQKLLLSGNKVLLNTFIEIIFEPKIVEEKYERRLVSILGDYNLLEVMKHKNEIIKLCGIHALELSKEILTNLAIDKRNFNIHWIPTIEDSDQKRFPENYENQLVNFVRDCLEFFSVEQIHKTVEELLMKEHPIFQRLAIHTIGCHYEKLNSLFWSPEENPLQRAMTKHEVYRLIENNCEKFSKTEIEIFINWVDSLDYNKKDEKALAYTKKEWLSACKKIKSPIIEKLYNQYDQINPAELEHPGYGVYYRSSFGSVSPINHEELLKMSNDDIAKYLNEFKAKNGFQEPSEDGLSNALRMAVFKNPQKFSENLEPFNNVNQLYQWSLLRGFVEAWRAKNKFNWMELFNYILAIINDSFWDRKYEEGTLNYRNWIISQVAELIDSGTKSDKNAFEESLLPKAEKNLLVLANRTESSMEYSFNLVNSVLNSKFGQIYSAMINYSLRYARLYKKDEKNKWVTSIQQHFEKAIDTSTSSKVELHLTLGKYLLNLLYLDKEWVDKNIQKIFPKESDNLWKAAFTGYLFYSSLNLHIYNLLKENKFYKKALEANFNDEEIEKVLIHHILVYYIEDYEKLNDPDSLISILISKGESKQLSEIVSYFWLNRDNKLMLEKVKSKTKRLWNALYNKLSKTEEDSECQKILSRLTKWLSIVDEIDEDIISLLKLPIKYLNETRSMPYFIEYLEKHVHKTPKKVAEIYEQIINLRIYPDYDPKHIKEIVGNLYKNGEIEIANRICNEYGEKGIYFLRPVYNEFN